MFGEQGQTILQFSLDELGNLASWLAFYGFVVVRKTIEDGHIAKTIHQNEVIEGAHCTCWGYLFGLGFVATEVFYHLIALGYARCEVCPVVQRFVFRVEVVQCRVYVFGVVIVVIAKTYARNLVG